MKHASGIVIGMLVVIGLLLLMWWDVRALEERDPTRPGPVAIVEELRAQNRSPSARENAADAPPSAFPKLAPSPKPAGPRSPAPTASAGGPSSSSSGVAHAAALHRSEDEPEADIESPQHTDGTP